MVSSVFTIKNYASWSGESSELGRKSISDECLDVEMFVCEEVDSFVCFLGGVRYHRQSH
jgi:hypothetical protein